MSRRTSLAGLLRGVAAASHPYHPFCIGLGPLSLHRYVSRRSRRDRLHTNIAC